MTRAPGGVGFCRRRTWAYLAFRNLSGLSYAEAVVVGALQGVTELFPVSSLGHSILLPAVIGGSWAQDLNVSAPESPYLAFIVGLHVATAAALLLFFRQDWIRIVGGALSAVRYRRVQTADERLAVLIVLATIPVGLSGLLLEHLFRTTLGRPVPAACFLIANGVLLLAGERLRRRPAAAQAALRLPATAQSGQTPAGGVLLGGVLLGDPAGRPPGADQREFSSQGTDPDARLAELPIRRAVLIGAAQILALLPGISRSGVTMVAGLARGLSHEDAARFSFLLATPVILAAGVLKVPDLFGPLGAGIHGQVLAGSLAAFVSAYLAVKFLTRWFSTGTLTPFGIYSLAAGTGCLVLLAAR